MIEFLTLQVRLGKITVESVPERYREAVAAAVAGDSHD